MWVRWKVARSIGGVGAGSDDEDAAGIAPGLSNGAMTQGKQLVQHSSVAGRGGCWGGVFDFAFDREEQQLAGASGS